MIPQLPQSPPSFLHTDQTPQMHSKSFKSQIQYKPPPHPRLTPDGSLYGANPNIIEEVLQTEPGFEPKPKEGETKLVVSTERGD